MSRISAIFFFFNCFFFKFHHGYHLIQVYCVGFYEESLKICIFVWFLGCSTEIILCIFTELTESSRELDQVYRVLADPLMVSYLVTVSTRLVPSQLQIGRVIPDSTDFLNLDVVRTSAVCSSIKRVSTIPFEGFATSNSMDTLIIIMDK